MAELLLRAGRIHITPTRAGELAGYAARRGAVSTGTHDTLVAALVVLDDGVKRIGWLTLDVIGIPEDLADHLRHVVREGLNDPELGLVVAASHTHSAPLGWVGSIHPGLPGVLDTDAVAELIERIRALVTRVRSEAAIPVTASWWAQPAPGLGTNRLDPAGPHDDSIGVLALRDTDGSVRAVVVDATTHPTVLGPSNLTWSADWPGALRAVLGAAIAEVNAIVGRTNKPPVVAFLQGAAGDISTRFTRRGTGFDEVVRLGALAAGAALTAVMRGNGLGGRLRHTSTILELDCRALPALAEVEREIVTATVLRGELRDLSDLDPRVRIAQTRLDGALMQRGLFDAVPADTMALPISVTAIGDVAWAQVPVELFASVGEQIRAESPFPVTRVVGYADGYRGYLVDAAAADGGSYEALSTFFPASAGTVLADALRDLLEQIR